MLRLFFCLIFIAPIFFLSSLLGNQNADASVEPDEDTYSAFTDAKISSLDNCEDESIPVYFSDEYVETHSAAFLYQAVEAAAHCANASVRVVNLTFDHMNDEELAFAREQADEVTEFVKAYETDVELERSARQAEVDTRALNGRAVVVEFEFEPSFASASAAR